MIRMFYIRQQCKLLHPCVGSNRAELSFVDVQAEGAISSSIVA